MWKVRERTQKMSTYVSLGFKNQRAVDDLWKNNVSGVAEERNLNVMDCKV